MDAIATDELRVRWRAPLIVMMVAIAAVFLLLLVSLDLGFFVSLFLVVPLAGVILLGFLFRRGTGTKLACVAILCVFALFSWQILKHSEAIRSETRWFAGSWFWKARVLDQSAKDASGLKAVVWDGWGMFAQDTDVYLVYSPDDGLREYSPANLSGLPCPVWHVQRLERQWYSVTFYTNEGWGDCGVSTR